MDLAQIIEALGGLPQSEADALIADAMAATKDYLFLPNGGPQTMGYFSEADVMLFGGSPGGGKTALEVGLALNEHHRSLIVRKNFVDLTGVLHTLDNIVGKEGASVGGNRPVYKKPEGGIIEFMGLGDKIDSKQGNPHDLICVGKQTPVLMADGSYRPAEKVKKGEMVATLEGPKRVLNAFATPPKSSVRVTAGGVSQIQSATHKLLATTGWLPVDLCNQIGSSSPKEYQKCHISCAPSDLISPSNETNPFPQPVGQRLQHGVDRAGLGTEKAGLSVFAACMESAGQGNASSEFDGRLPRRLRHLLSSALLRVLRLLRCEMVGAARTLRHCACACGTSDEQRTSIPQDCPDDCSGGSHPCDARTREPLGHLIGSKDGQSNLLLLADAERQNPIGSPMDEAETAPKRTLHKWSYEHPYTGDERQSILEVVESACDVVQLGDVELFDLEVEDVNHFITLGGFINKNCIDEAAQVPEKMVRMLMGWLRTDKEGQRCRVVLGSNPPLDSTGDWLIGYFAPWLDPTYPNPAQEGELRYFLPKDGGGDRECSADERTEIHGIKVRPQSRTFISSSFTDNPYYNAEDYAKSLAGLPDAQRGVLISGSFLMDRSDDVWQSIPTQWVKEAQERWTSTPPMGVPMCSIGVDIAQGGADDTVIAPRYDGYFSSLTVVPGSKTPDGKTAAGVIVSKRMDQAKVIVDIGGGWGGDCYAALRENGIDASSYMGVKPATGRTVDGQLGFTNIRTRSYWRLREALDPSQPGGSPIMLPRDAILLADLCAPKYSITPNGIKLESKEDVVKRLGRSPDRGDAVVMAWSSGLRGENVKGGFASYNKRTPQVIMGANRRS